MVDTATATQVRKLGSNFEMWDAGLKDVLGAFGREVGKNIYAYNAHGMPKTPDQISDAFTSEYGSFDNDALYFVFWSSPAESSDVGDDVGANLGGIFGNRYEELVPMSYPTRVVGTGTLLASVENDQTYVFGEVVGNIIYINWDLPHEDYGVAFLGDAMPIINNAVFGGDGISLEEWTARFEQEREARSRQAYIEACRPRLNVRSESLEATMNSLVSRHNQLLAEVAQNVQEQQRNNIELTAAHIAENRANKDQDKFGREWDILKDNANVGAVRWEDGNHAIVVTTVPIVSHKLPDASTRDLGRIEIWFYTQSNGDRFIGLRNLDYNGGDFGNSPHPHASSEFDICWGSVGTAISMLSSQYEFAAATEVLLRFLQEPNAADAWGRRVYRYPVLSEDPDREPYTPGNDYGRRARGTQFCNYCGENPCVGCGYDSCTEEGHTRCAQCNDNCECRE